MYNINMDNLQGVQKNIELRKGVIFELRISIQNLNENLEILHLARTQFYHLSGFILKQDF